MEPSSSEGSLEVLYLAGGCFWGMEHIFRSLPQVLQTSVGYMGGNAPDPTYEEVCSGKTGHAEAVRVEFAPGSDAEAEILAIFFESHDPTTLNRQGADRGTQYRSAIWTTTEEQYKQALQTRESYQTQLTELGYGPIVTEISAPPAPLFYLAEDYHQRYLEKNPGGYCNHGFNGVACPRGLQ